MAQRRWHSRRWTIWLLLKKTTWSSGSYKKYELLNHFVCSKDKAHFLRYHTWTVLFLWRQFCEKGYSEQSKIKNLMIITNLWQEAGNGPQCWSQFLHWILLHLLLYKCNFLHPPFECLLSLTHHWFAGFFHEAAGILVFSNLWRAEDHQ